MTSVGLVAYLKALHISALVFWCAGLVALPAMLLRRCDSNDREEMKRIRRSNHQALVLLASPAGFLAIGSGIALIFANRVFDEWLFLKLAVVGVLLTAHLTLARMVMRVTREHDWQPPTRWVAPTMLAVLGAVVAILWLVLAKPSIGTDFLPWWMQQPLGAQDEVFPAGRSSSSSSSSATTMPI